MNNIFNLTRFSNFALMNYWYHKKQYLGVMAATVVILLIVLCEGNFTFTAVSWESNRLPIDRVINIFSRGFYFVGPLFTLMFIRISMQGINGRALTMHDMLIPVSTFERYIFAILNSTIVAVVVYVLLFQLTSTFVESMYLFSDNGYAFKGFLGYNGDTIVNGGFVNECNISLSDVITNAIHPNSSKAVEINFYILSYTLLVSIFMWGEITFQSAGAPLKTALLHIVAGAFAVGLFAYTSFKTIYPVAGIQVSFDMMESVNKYEIFLVMILYILPITYQWVIWKKLKNISLTK